MSVFAGVLHLDDAPGAVEDIVTFGAAPSGGWDQDDGHVEGPLAFRWQYRWTTPESVGERQPITCPQGRIVLSYSGRLDNREELITRYRTPPSASDGALLAATIAADGVGGLRHCVGDFVFAAWDRAARRLWLGRDALGHRPLFYARDGARLIWSTDLRVVRNATRLTTPNAGYLAEFLNCTEVSLHETAFAGIARVPPATVLSIAPGASSLSSTEYWTPPTTLPARRADAELVDEFRERFAIAVRACLRAHGSVASELSGGLDSSSIVAMMRALSGHAPDTYSIVYPGAPRAADGERLDESAFIDAMVAAVGASSFRHDPRTTGPGDVLRVLTLHGDVPDWPNSDLVRWPMVCAAATGHRVLLTGVGGDQWLTGTVARVPALLRAGRFLEAERFIRHAVGRDRLEAEWWPMWRRLATAAVPASLKRAFRSVRPARPWPAWLRESFVAETNLAGRLRALPGRVPACADPVLRESLTRLASAEGPNTREALFRSSDDAGIEARHPFFDRRLVEFVLTLPDDLRFRDGRTRHILREAMGALLPSVIATRRDKGDSTLLLAHAVRATVTGMPMASLRVADLGWVDGDWLRAECAAIVQSNPATRVPQSRDMHVWTAVAVEVWLRALDAET